MASEPALAFIRSSESLARLPRDCRVVPLRPHLAVPKGLGLAIRPEDLLDAEAIGRIESVAAAILSGWRALLSRNRPVWHGVDLAACFDYEVRLVGLDLAKTLVLIERAMADSRAGTLLTDAPPVAGAFPAYPYLSGLRAVAGALATQVGWRFESLGPEAPSAGGNRSQASARVYGALAGRRGAARIRKGDFICAVGPHPEVYRPLAGAWKKEHRAVVVLTPSRAPVRAAEPEGLFLSTTASLLDREDRDAAHAFASAVCDDLRASSGAPPGIPAAVVAPLKAHLLARMSDWLPELGEVGIAFERGLERAEGLALLETASPFSGAAAGYARKAGVARTVLQHGVIAEAFSYRLLHADRVAAWGGMDEAWFRSELAPSVRIQATGSPRYDSLRRGRGTEADDPLPEIPTSTPVVLFASQPFVQGHPQASLWDRRAVAELVVEVMRQARGYRIVQKRHPSEEADGILPPEDEALARHIHHRNTLALIQRCFVLLAVSSTVALEAMYLGRPVVFLGPPIHESPFRPPEEGGGLRAQSAEELRRHLDALLSDASFRAKTLAGQDAYLAKAYAPLDGRASERIVELMKGS